MKSYDEIKRESAGAQDGALADTRARMALLISVGVTVLLYAVPFGRLLAYPLVLLSTLVHELGHGITAAVLGGSFHEFFIHPDASGVAIWSGELSDEGRALVSAGGLIGPAIAGAIGFVSARRHRTAQVFLAVMSLALVVALVLVVKNPFGIGFVAACAALFAAAAFYDKGSWAQLVLVFLSTQLALAVFSRGDYLFVAEAKTAQGTMPSDVSHIAQALGGPFWAWGLIVGLWSLLVLGAGLYLFLRPARTRRIKPS